MSFLLDDTAVGGQLFVGAGSPIALGIGEAKVRGSAFVEGPQITGSATEFPQIIGSLMVAPSENERKKVFEEVATPISRISTEFCSAITMVCMDKPSPAPTNTAKIATCQ